MIQVTLFLLLSFQTVELAFKVFHHASSQATSLYFNQLYCSKKQSSSIYEVDSVNRKVSIKIPDAFMSPSSSAFANDGTIPSIEGTADELKSCDAQIINKTNSGSIRVSISAMKYLGEINVHISNGKTSNVLSIIRDVAVYDMSKDEINFLASKAMMSFSTVGNWKICSEIITLLNEINVLPDSYTYTTAMSALIKHKKYDEAIDIFDKMKQHITDIDVIAYMSLVRAIGHVRDWKSTIEVLNESYRMFGNGVLPIAHTAIINLKYYDVHHHTSESMYSEMHLIDKAYSLLDWLTEQEIPMTSQTMDAILAVICTHGDKDMVEAILIRMSHFVNPPIKPSRVTFNTLLDRCAVDADITGALEIMHIMKKWRFAPDTYTYNTLLKLCFLAKDIAGAQEVLDYMNSFGVAQDAITKSLIIQLYSLSSNIIQISKLLDDEGDDDITPHMFANAIGSCTNDWKRALILLQRASKVKKADSAVYTETAKICISSHEYDNAFRVIDLMLNRGIEINKYSLSFIITACLQAPDGRGIYYLEKYLDTTYKSKPELLTNAICQRIITELTSRRFADIACNLHLGPLRNLTCKSDTLKNLYIELQLLCIQDDDATALPKTALATKALALLGMYSLQDSARHLLRTAHFNSVLRMLTHTNMYIHIEELYKMMSGSTAIALQQQSPSVSNTRIWTWRPGTFTIAEMVRSSREAKKPQLAASVIQWAATEGTFLPSGVISDAISFVYGEGRTDLTKEMYECLYIANYIQHWSDKGNLEIDLHAFSRGMAYGAISVALSEIRKMIASNNRSTGSVINIKKSSKNIKTQLTIITGRSINRKEPSDNNGKDSGSSTAYLLSEEVQRCLIEDFFPPISSSTVVNNPGRLYIDIEM